MKKAVYTRLLTDPKNNPLEIYWPLVNFRTILISTTDVDSRIVHADTHPPLNPQIKAIAQRLSLALSELEKYMEVCDAYVKKYRNDDQYVKTAHLFAADIDYTPTDSPGIGRRTGHTPGTERDGYTIFYVEELFEELKKLINAIHAYVVVTQKISDEELLRGDPGMLL